MACEFLVEQGFDVTNMLGGMMAWQGDIVEP
jgi:rhodanese-related sulfurtransferase